MKPGENTLAAAFMTPALSGSLHSALEILVVAAALRRSGRDDNCQDGLSNNQQSPCDHP